MTADPDGSGPAPAPARPRRRLTWQAAVAGQAAAAAIATAALATGQGGGSAKTDAKAGTAAAPAADGLPHTTVDVGPSTCGHGWNRPRSGTQVFDLHNSAGSATDVYLTDPHSGKVYGEVDGVAPGISRPLVVDLGGGSYAFKCLQQDTDAVTGPTVVVPGNRPRGPAAMPVTQHDLIPATLAYQRWVGGRLSDLARGTAALKADIDRGDLTAARRDWLSAHLVYERMGAAYGTFGAADTAINGTAGRGPGAVRDPGFTGFHRVEYGLWHGEPAPALRAPAATLDVDVRALKASWAQQRMDPADLGLRAHEIVENSQQFELTGRTDYGSGTNLATARANLDGSRELLGQLHSLLAARYPSLPQLDTALNRTRTALDAARHGGSWTPLDKLTRAQRELINSDFGALLERLAPVAAICDVRRTA